MILKYYEGALMIDIQNHTKTKPLRTVSIKLSEELIADIKAANINLSSYVRAVLDNASFRQKKASKGA